MLYYGNGNYIPDDCKVVNLNSMKEGYPRFAYLVPPNNMGYCTGRDFDIAYYNYIIQNDVVFTEFFSIIYELYANNCDVFILIDENMDWAENIAESLFKAIQQRYGYNAIKVETEEDYLYFKNNTQESQFNQEWGIYNLDIDKERYTIIIETNRLRAGGSINYE